MTVVLLMLELIQYKLTRLGYLEYWLQRRGRCIPIERTYEIEVCFSQYRQRGLRKLVDGFGWPSTRTHLHLLMSAEVEEKTVIDGHESSLIKQSYIVVCACTMPVAASSSVR